MAARRKQHCIELPETQERQPPASLQSLRCGVPDTSKGASSCLSGLLFSKTTNKKLPWTCKSLR